MSSVIATHSPADSRFIDRLPRVIAALPVWVWALVAFAIIAAGGLAHNLGELAQNLGDTDDATRLVQVRDLLAGAPWYTPTLARLAGGEAVLSHWSRLVDLPIAALMWTASLVLPMPQAEIAVRALWPLLVLLPLVLLLARTLEVSRGRLVAACALAQLVLTPAALAQFHVGRIDHHNLQILGAVGAVLLLWCGLQQRRRTAFGTRSAAWAGALAGLSLGVGYEALPLVALTALAATLWALLDEDVSAPVAVFAAALAGTVLAAFLATVPPGRWLAVHCDTLSANLVVLAACGAAGLGLIAGPGRGRPLTTRLAILGLTGTLGTSLFGLLEPACLRGPFGQVPDSLGPVWMDHVQETFNLFRIARGRPAEGLAGLALLLAGCAAQVIVWRRTRAPEDQFLLALIVAMALLAVAQVKFLPYASWLALVAMAAFAAGLPATRGVSAVTVRLAGVILGSHLMLYMQVSAVIDTTTALAGPSSKPGIAAAGSKATEACFKVDTVRALAALPKSLIVTDIDLGPAIVATTAHTVLAAPYHRIVHGIAATQQILGGPLDEAHQLLKTAGAGYVVICAGLANPGIDRDTSARHLSARLQRGEVPAFLEPVAVAVPDKTLQVYRVRP